MSGEIYVRPGAGERDPEFAAAMYRAESAAEPKPKPEHPKDFVGRTRSGWIIRRDGSRFPAGPLLDLETIPLVN